MSDKIRILAIESSCDETSASVVENGRKVLSLVTKTQISTHAEYGGVVPEIASRMHVEAISSLVRQALADANMNDELPDAIAVTYGPGLVGALLVGVSYAKAYAWGIGKPLIGVHHIHGHIAGNYLSHPELEPPYLAMIVSGGHTQIIRVMEYDRFELLGSTIDDAAGEAFDKGARVLGLPYPGGKVMDVLASKGNPAAFPFTRAKTKSPFDCSFSGLKTALAQLIQNHDSDWIEANIEDIAASYQEAIIDTLIRPLCSAIDQIGAPAVAICGGVSANRGLRNQIQRIAEEKSLRYYLPDLVYCTDNAAMIGSAAYYLLQKGNTSDLTLNAVPYLELGT
ncbi:MAG: tRNA (adenosine(37)-N6)-threonylcarbamoyltransferase complex transferase subunit TsaD [Christensenellales bacterium]|jgi:N6-L-threonylcarbamoyladenine synthase